MIRLKLLATSYTKIACSAVISLFLAVSIILLLPVEQAAATGSASFNFPTSGTYTVGSTISVQIQEDDTNSGDAVNAVEANLLYPTSLLQFDSSTINGPFDNIVQTNSGGSGSVNIAIASYSGVADNTENNVSDLTFTVLAAGSTSTTTSSPYYFGMTAGNPPTGIDVTSGSSVWNGLYPAAAYTFNAVSSGGGSSGGGTSGSTSGGSSGGSTGATTSGSSKSSGSSSKSSSSAPSSPVPAASTPTTLSTTPAASSTPTTTTTATTTLCSLSITVTDSQDKPIVGALVTLNNGKSATTNSYGVVSFSGITASKYSVTITDPGKKPVKSSVTVGSGQNKLANYKLTSNSPLKANYIGLGVLIVIVLAIGFIFLRRIRSGFHPQLSGVDNGVVVGGVTPIVSSPPDPVNSTSAEQPTVSQPTQPEPVQPPAEPTAGTSDPDTPKVISPEVQNGPANTPGNSDQPPSTDDPKPL